jgi:hypothetical protein
MIGHEFLPPLDSAPVFASGLQLQRYALRVSEFEFVCPRKAMVLFLVLGYGTRGRPKCLSPNHISVYLNTTSILTNKKVQRDMELGRSLFLVSATVQHGLGTFH